MNYHKRIILDFDDTLAFAEGRNWDDAVPNRSLITKTNGLFDNGWQIDIFTARGSISCQTRAQARLKYERGMKTWLEKHGVKYHSISFEKPLAAYYIDDKGMSPEEFIMQDIRQLHGGLSGSDIYTDGAMVHKQDKNAHQTKEWYKTACYSLNVPCVDRIVGDTITMRYIDHDVDFFRNNTFIALGLIQDALAKMSAIPFMDGGLTFSSYIDRIKDHAKNSGVQAAIDNASKLELIKPPVRTFAHGDFGITNMLFGDGKLHLIDPITSVYGSTELDIAKFIASLYINEYPQKMIDTSLRSLVAFNNLYHSTMIVLVCAEITRVYKYHPNKEHIRKCIENVFQQG